MCTYSTCHVPGVVHRLFARTTSTLGAVGVAAVICELRRAGGVGAARFDGRRWSVPPAVRDTGVFK
jgi:hypothetical protein